MQRGKVDIYIAYEDCAETTGCVKYNKKIAEEYVNYLGQMAEDFGLENDIRTSTLSRYPDVFTLEDVEEDEDEIWKELDKALKSALQALVETRIKEGENLRNDLIGKLDGMLKHVDYITERSPEIIAEYKKKLTDKVKDLLQDAQVDEIEAVQPHHGHEQNVGQIGNDRLVCGEDLAPAFQQHPQRLLPFQHNAQRITDHQRRQREVKRQPQTQDVLAITGTKNRFNHHEVTQNGVDNLHQQEAKRDADCARHLPTNNNRRNKQKCFEYVEFKADIDPHFRHQ